MKVPNKPFTKYSQSISLSRLQNEGSQLGAAGFLIPPKSIKATE